MPHVKISTNGPVSTETQKDIYAAVCEKAGMIGKAKEWMMVEFSECSIFFRDEDDAAAVVDVDLFGAAGAEAYSNFTAAMCEILKTYLAIPQNRVYVKYGEYQHWGWNGSNF